MLPILTATIKEARRTNFFIAVLAIAVLSICFMDAIASFSIESRNIIVTDMGFFIISFLSMLITVYLAVEAVQSDITGGALYYVLSKDCSRNKYLLGKFFGVYAVGVLVLSSLFFICIVFGYFISFGFFLPLYLTAAEFLIITSLAFLFSVSFSRFPAFIMSVMVYVMGHMQLPDEYLAGTFDARWKIFFYKCLYFFIPDLELMNTKYVLFGSGHVSMNYLVKAGVYSAAYSSIVLIAALFIFNKKDL